MRRWIWGALAIGGLVVLIGLLMPQQRAAAPEPQQMPAPGAPTAPGTPQSGLTGEDLQIAGMREIADKMEQIELTRIERLPGGVVEVDARYTGPEEQKPVDQAEWNRLAKELANALARAPANVMTVRVRLHENGTMRAEEVTTRSE